MPLLQTITRLLTFRLTRAEMLNFDKTHFIAGLLGTWLVGMGRYWDDPLAKLVQHLGLGSVIYIFVLALLIWLILLPFRVEKWRYFTVLTFISLTSFPAIFYAIPVEQFFSIETANTINVWFLAVVAAWRLGLLFYFLSVFTQLSKFNIITVTLMPVCLIIATLTALNLHHVVFNIMGGIREPNAHTGAYIVLIYLTSISVILIGPLLIAYGVGVYQRMKAIKQHS